MRINNQINTFQDIDSADTTTSSGKPTNIRLVKYFVRGQFKPDGTNG